jgi:hypothetical protein
VLIVLVGVVFAGSRLLAHPQAAAPDPTPAPIVAVTEMPTTVEYALIKFTGADRSTPGTPSRWPS